MGEWIRFEEGLSQSKIIEKRLANINEESYKQFREKCVNHKLAKERRVILFFWGTNSSIRKKDRRVNADENSIAKLLIESIMDSCTRSKEGKDEFLTAAVVRCEDSDIVDAASVKWEKVKSKKDNPTTELAKRKLDEGDRIVDNRKISLWEKYLLIDKDIRETANSLIKKLLSGVLGILVEYWLLIISMLYFLTEFWQEKIVKPYGYVLIIFGVLYRFICGCSKKVIEQAREEAREKVRKEIRYYRSLDYPVIFYNETRKTKKWMKKYIQKYIKGEEEEKTKKSVFYIGPNNSKLDEKVHEFIIPKGHPEWGLICLCKLVRDLADNPWGAIWSGTAVIDKVKDKSVFSPSLETDKEQNSSDKQLQIFKMPNDEKELRDQIEEKRNWHFARDPSNKDPESRLFPIGNSVYVIRDNISWSDFKGEVIELQRKIVSEIGVFNSINYQFWLIQVVKSELEVIEVLNMISSMQIWDNDWWEDIWQSIIQLIKSFQNENISELCGLVWDEKKATYWMSFVNFKKFLENGQKEDVVEEKTLNRNL